MTETIVARDIEVLPPRREVRGWRGPSPKRLAFVGVGLALLAGAAWYGNDWWNNGRFIETTDDAYVGGNTTALAPHVGGFVAEVPIADNQRVKAGQLLIRLDARDYQAAYDRATAVVDARAAALDELRARIVLQQSTIRQQEAELQQRSAQLVFAVQDAERYAALAQTPAGSRQDAQRTGAAEQAGRAAVAAAAAALATGRQQLKVLDAQIAAAEAALAQARADLETARLNLGYTEIRSPIDGTVGNRAAQVGAYVTAGTYLLSVIPGDGLWVDANFKEDQLARMASGDAATVTVDQVPGHVFHGHVASLAPGTGAVFSVIPAENATGNFTKIVQRVPVRIVLDGDDPALRRLRPGLSTISRVDTRLPDEQRRAAADADMRQ